MMERSDTLTVLLVIGGLLLLAVLAVAVVYFVRLARLWSLVRDPAMPAAGKFAFWAAMIYAVFPVDVLPDPIYLDDVGVLAAATAFVLRGAKRAGLLDRRRGLRPDRPGVGGHGGAGRSAGQPEAGDGPGWVESGHRGDGSGTALPDRRRPR